MPDFVRTPRPAERKGLIPRAASAVAGGASAMLPLTLAAASGVLVIALLGCGNGTGQESSAPPPAPLVEAVAARFGALPVEESVPGVVRARNQVEIRPEVEARVVEVMVRSGAAVERGQALVRLDPVEARERLRQAEADVRLAEAAAAAGRARVAELEARLARTHSLAQEGLVSAQELETLEAELDVLRATAAEAAARVEQANAAAEEQRSALAKTVVRAPVAGRLGERRAEVGMMVDPATVLFVVGDLNELIVEVTLTEAMLGRVQEGQLVLIEPRGGAGAPVRAELSRISPFLAQQSFTTVGEIDVDNRDGRLRPGMFVNVRILVGESRRATLIPAATLWEDPASGSRGVFVVEEAAGLEALPGAAASTQGQPRSVTFRRVEVLAEGRGAVGVAGIEQGEWVVTIGQHLLSVELERGPRPAGGPNSAFGRGPQRAAPARVRPVSWERVAALQNLQDEDLLEGFLDKQRKLAAALGAEIPESEDVVNRVLEEAAKQKQAGPDER